VIVVPDAGPLIYLAGAERLDVLARLFDRVVVPRVVYEEIVVAGAGLMGSAAVSAASWIEIADAPPDALLARTLDRGEAAAIPLAERLAATLLCDDAAA
jgi:predicted nucleic acid-binding protein